MGNALAQASLERLVKLLALAGSDNEGERLNAITKANALLKRHSMSMVDLPEVWGGSEKIRQLQEAAERTCEYYATTIRIAIDAEEEARHAREAAETRATLAERRAVLAERGTLAALAAEKRARRALDAQKKIWDARKVQKVQKAEGMALGLAALTAEQEAKQRRAHERKDARGRKALIARYSSVEVALAPCEWEAQLRQAVREWSVNMKPPDERWTRAIGRCCPVINHVADLPRSVLKALEHAYPLPKTLADAYAEYAYWERRGRETGLLEKRRAGPRWRALDPTASYRCDLVCEALAVGLRAVTVDDLVYRQRYKVDLADDKFADEFEVRCVT